MAQLSFASSPLRGPLLAGLGAAGALVLGVATLTWLAGGPAPTISAGIDLDPSLARQNRAELEIATDHTAAHDPFAPSESDTTQDVSLPGVTDTEHALMAEPHADPSHAPRTTALNAPRAPLPGLYENGPGGPLPIISASGQRPDQAYAAAFDGLDTAPTLSVIVGGLGLSESLTAEAIETLPAEVTLSFAPYADNLQDWINRARADGHEVLIELPMEPFDYPNNDPGPHTLLVDAETIENTRRLTWLLSRSSGYVGVANYLGARLGAAEGPLIELFNQIEARGLSIFHDGSGRRAVLNGAGQRAQARLALADRVLDADPIPSAIDDRLLELEALALQNGTALGSAFAYPATVDTVAAWAESVRERGYQLAPASYLMSIRHPITDSHSATSSHDSAHAEEAHHDDGHGDTH